MPKIVKIREYNPPNLLEDFSSNDISPASGNDLGSTTRYAYNASSDLRLWIRFKSGAPVDLVNYDPDDKPTIVYEGSVETSELPVLNNRMLAARFDNTDNKNAKLTFPGGAGNTNILSFGDGSTQDLPFSVSFWFKKLPENSLFGSDDTDNFFWKANSTSYIEFGAAYIPGSEEIRFFLCAAGNASLVQGIIGDATGILTDNQWHHIVLTYDGTGGMSANTGMNIYIDGVVLSKTPNNLGTYTYMDNVTEVLYIAADYDGDAEADGNMAEFAIWAKELSLEEIRAIYNWTYEDSVVKSGYTNLPPRIRLRDIDNRPGCYPTKHRMGDKDRSGKANIFYEDLPIQFGNKIEDDFKLPPELLFGQDSDFDKTKWVVSAGLSIRKEYRQVTDGEYEIDDCAVFSGPGTSGERYIRTKNKIRNPHTVTFDLLQGPYNKGEDRLNLKRGRASYSLKLQISTDSSFSTSTTIATYVLDSSNLSFYGLTTLNKKPSKTIKLGLKDFPDPGAAYYLRLVQDDYVSSVSSWAIRNIKIEYANQNIRYPLNLNYADTAGNKIARQLISLPHTSGTLSGTGRSLKGISDVANPFQTFEEDISPFDETLAIENADIAFFNEGLDPKVYPGFSSPTRSKTKFTIDLSPSEEITFGMTTPLPVSEVNAAGDTSETGSQLMIYWNNQNKKWEKRGQVLRGFNSSTPTLENYATILTGACIGFSGVTLLGTASNSTGNDFSFLSKDQLSLSNKIIDQFNFPFGEQYYATSSQTIKASELGITKPFLLEGISLDFQSKFESPGSNNHSLSFIYSVPWFLYGDANKSSVGSLSRLKIITPTFFILRQFKDSYSKEVFIQSGSGEQFKYTINLPTQSYLNDGDTNSVYVSENREIITFGQHALFVSGVVGGTTGISNIITQKTANDFIAAGLKYNNFSQINVADMKNDLSLTQSLSIHAKTVTNSKYPLTYSTRYQLAGGSNLTQLLFGKDGTSRTEGSIKSSRGIVNGFSSTTLGENIIIPGEKGGVPKQFVIGQDSEKILSDSPYLIFPEDDLILGWQYPFPNQCADFGKGVDPGTDSIAFNSMTLFGKSKLHLYGSEVIQNKEFHETVNQNLTSCAVYEHVIGDEKVLDQWQVPYRGEMTGSYAARTNFSLRILFQIPNNISMQTTTYTCFGNPEWVFRASADDGGLEFVDYYTNANTKYRVNGFKKINPVKRIGLFTFSPVGGFEDFNTKVSGLSTENARLYFPNAPSSELHVRLRDEDRIFIDSTRIPGSFYDDSSYGTMIRSINDQDRNFALSFNASVRDTTPVFAQSFPKYRFNYKHYGYYADMFQQGKDSKFKRTILAPKEENQFDIVVTAQAPVRTVFVEGKTTEGSEQKIYSRKRLEFLLDDENFQSSNLSTFSTSSMPFIDDNTPRNRTYITNPVITLP